MSHNAMSLRERVQGIMPDLEIEQFEMNNEGLINDVVIVNGMYVFRFAKKKEYARTLDVETRILDLIRSEVGVNVPTPIYNGEDCVVYPYLHGEPLLLERIMALDESSRIRISEDLGKFLFSMHTTDISGVEEELPSTLAPVTRERWLNIYRRVKTTVYPLLWKHQVTWAEHLFNGMLMNPHSFEYKPALIHGDLRPYHILIDNRNCEITGVIDFGVAGIGDPASDIGTLINTYGESFVIKMKHAYPNLGEYLARARFYAQSIELQWVLLGIEMGENFWFAAHLGCARDVRS
ncbi:MAG TPA: phosphotransferase [Acidobacteriota bacterium]|nr:phosphotransferase [Acidobacteriota bacterium]